MLKELGIPYPDYGSAYTVDEAIEVANQVGYPVLVRPSYVLGGQRMRIVSMMKKLRRPLSAS
ncbi:carbamoyl-phosphate synthase large chain, partial [Filimonas sp.]